jgi:hypothetical protein
MVCASPCRSVTHRRVAATTDHQPGDSRSGHLRAQVWLLVAIVLVLTVFSVLTGRLLYWPATNPPQPGQADAVLVLSGGTGERHVAGIRLMQQASRRCWWSPTGLLGRLTSNRAC